MKYRYASHAFAMAICACLLACEKEKTEVQNSVSYFSQHPNEAEVMVTRCKAEEKESLSLMSPSQRLAWEETAHGINCRNANQARSESKYSDYQRRMREEAKKYQ